MPMRLTRAPQLACERAREAVSLALDGELSELARARLNGHLRRCASCRTFGREAAATTRLLRTAPLEEMPVPVILPGRRRVGVRLLQVGAAAAVVALVAGVSTMHRLGDRTTSAAPFHLSPTAALGHDDELPIPRPRRPRLTVRNAV